MFELRWVIGGSNRVLEYRTRRLVVNAWGNPVKVAECSGWEAVPEIDVNEAAMGDLIASGGLPASGG